MFESVTWCLTRAYLATFWLTSHTHQLYQMFIKNKCIKKLAVTLDHLNKCPTYSYANLNSLLDTILPQPTHYSFSYWSWTILSALIQIQFCVVRPMQVQWTRYSVTPILPLHIDNPMTFRYIQNPPKNWLTNNLTSSLLRRKLKNIYDYLTHISNLT